MMAARIETLQSEVESLRKDVDERDIVAILLDNAIKMGLLRTDHIQYLSLKWGLLQAFGITHSEAKMTGEFAKLKDFNESLKFHSSKALINLLRGPAGATGAPSARPSLSPSRAQSLTPTACLSLRYQFSRLPLGRDRRE